MFYIKQNFPLSDELWKGIDTSFSVNFLLENYFVDIEKKLITPLITLLMFQAFFIQFY